MATTAGKGPDIPERGDPVGSDRSYRHRFVAVWPEVECRLLDMLRRRGITREVAEDAVQTAAERAYARQLDFDRPGELFAWCSVTAWRAALKVVRKDGRLDLGGVPERSRPEDVESQARQRMALEAVAGAIERMPVDDRAVLIGRAQTSTSGDPRRDAHRRHRLRAQLAKVVEGLLGVFPGILRQLRRRMWRPRTSLVGISVAATAGVFVGLWTLSGVPPSSTVPVHARPRVTPARGVSGPAGLPVPGSHRGSRGVDGQTPGDSGHEAPVFAVGVTVAGQPVGNTLRRGRGDEPLVCTNVVPGPQPTCVAQPTQGLPPLPTPLRPGPMPP